MILQHLGTSTRPGLLTWALQLPWPPPWPPTGWGSGTSTGWGGTGKCAPFSTTKISLNDHETAPWGQHLIPTRWHQLAELLTGVAVSSCSMSLARLEHPHCQQLQGLACLNTHLGWEKRHCALKRPQLGAQRPGNSWEWGWQSRGSPGQLRRVQGFHRRAHSLRVALAAFSFQRVQSPCQTTCWHENSSTCEKGIWRKPKHLPTSPELPNTSWFPL